MTLNKESFFYHSISFFTFYSDYSGPKEPVIYNSFVRPNSVYCERAGFHKPVRASHPSINSLKTRPM